MKLRRSVTPQQKIIHTNRKLGNKGIKRQQGTTRILYDSLEIDGRQDFRFFEGSNNRDFPLTNSGSNGNQLGVGETLAVERAYFNAFSVNPITSLIIMFFIPLNGGAFDQIATGELTFEVANSKVIKPIPLLSFYPEFNKNAYHVEYNNFEFDTQIVIPPLLEFVFPIRTSFQPAVADNFLRFTVEGVGSIIAPRTTL